jgi:alkanesulfonate monooxygenase SsuD/methylene tetrahydromethanopterin reductase-like flavin-dependent oxidoreductase (luciferase family)
MQADSASAWRNAARTAEDLGYSTLYVADHYLGPGPVYDRTVHLPQILALIASIAVAAEATTTPRVGYGVVAVDFHLLAALAAETATLDLLSDGRLEVGLGAGVLRGEFEAMGLPFDEPKIRVDRLTEVVRLLKAAWFGRQMDFVREHVRVRGYWGVPNPVPRSHPPIMIGGGKRRTLALAGQEAQIASFNVIPFVPGPEALTPWQELEQRIAWVRNGRASASTKLSLRLRLRT